MHSWQISNRNGYFSDRFARVDKSKDEQPHWVTPVATTTPRLEEEYRYDQLWQTNTRGITTNNYDGGKGLELIPFEKVEVIFNVPPYLDHSDPKLRDGFGDVAFLVKYRLLSANEEHGGYILTAFLGWSLPTGDHTNGAPHAVITPTISYGKGLGNFEYRLFRKLWPEVELNSTFIQDGPRDGMKQNFVTPGLLIGRLHLWKRVGFTFGGGYQIATTHFHTSNHNGILSIRFPF